MTGGTLTPDIGSVVSSATANDNNAWVWDPDLSKYRQWSDSGQAGRVAYSSLGIRIQPASVNRLTSYSSPVAGNTAGLSVSGEPSP